MSCACVSPETESPKPIQACIPSNHVCSYFESSGSPHLLNQAPSRAQQLRIPDLLIMPHLGQLIPGVGVLDMVLDTGEAAVVALVVIVRVRVVLVTAVVLGVLGVVISLAVTRGLLQACMPSNHVCS